MDGVTFPYAYMGTDELKFESTSLDETIGNLDHYIKCVGDSDDSIEEFKQELSATIDALEVVNEELFRRAVWAEKAVELRDLALEEKEAVLQDAYATNARYFAVPHCKYEALCVECFLNGSNITWHVSPKHVLRPAEAAALPSTPVADWYARSLVTDRPALTDEEAEMEIEAMPLIPRHDFDPAWAELGYNGYD